MRTLAFLLLISLVSGLSSCEKNCGPSDEPRLTLRISTPATGNITEVYALKAIPGSPALTPPQSTSAPNRMYWQLNLPINLNADKTQYVIARASRRDTVSVQYRRVFAYEDAGCGYTVSLLPPLNSRNAPIPDSLIVQTTTGKLNSVLFIPTTSRSFFSAASNAGIDVSLAWL